MARVSTLPPLHLSPNTTTPPVPSPPPTPSPPSHQMDIYTPKDYIGTLMDLAQDRRGEFVEMKFVTEARTQLSYDMPLGEVGKEGGGWGVGRYQRGCDEGVPAHGPGSEQGGEFVEVAGVS